MSFVITRYSTECEGIVLDKYEKTDIDFGKSVAFKGKAEEKQLFVKVKYKNNILDLRVYDELKYNQIKIGDNYKWKVLIE